MRKIVVLSVVALVSLLSFAPLASASEAPALEALATPPAVESAADAEAVLMDGAVSEQCSATADETTAETTSVEIAPLVEADFSCLVCWRNRDCNTYCGGPWGVCSQGCCACTM